MTRSISFTPATGTLLIKGARIPYEYSSWDDNPKKSILLAVDEQTADTIKGWEAQIDSERLCTVLTDNGLRVKVDIDSVRAWAGEARVPVPESVQGTCANAAISLTRIWHSKKQSGLSLLVTDIEIVEDNVESPFIWPRDKVLNKLKCRGADRRAVRSGTARSGSSIRVHLRSQRPSWKSSASNAEIENEPRRQRSEN